MTCRTLNWIEVLIHMVTIAPWQHAGGHNVVNGRFSCCFVLLCFYFALLLFFVLLTLLFVIWLFLLVLFLIRCSCFCLFLLVCFSVLGYFLFSRLLSRVSVAGITILLFAFASFLGLFCFVLLLFFCMWGGSLFASSFAWLHAWLCLFTACLLVRNLFV